MMGAVNRWALSGPPNHYKTYSMRMPFRSHHRKGTCEEVNCDGYQYGWVTRVDESTTTGTAQAQYIRYHAGRRYRETRDLDGHTVFDFYPGQSCFREHSVSLEREPFFYVAPIDLSRSGVAPHNIYRHHNAADWLDDCATHQQKIADLVQRG